jgi:hypothetical protein
VWEIRQCYMILICIQTLIGPRYYVLLSILDLGMTRLFLRLVEYAPLFFPCLDLLHSELADICFSCREEVMIMGPVDLRPRQNDFGFVKDGGEILKGMLSP